MPDLISALTTLSAPCLVRVKTKARVQGVFCSQCVSSADFCVWSIMNTDWSILSTVLETGVTSTSTGLVNQRSASSRYRTRHRGREHQRLPLGRNLVDDLAQVVDKAHVEHPVGLVDDQHFDVRQIDVTLLHQIQQPAGRGDDNVDTAVEARRTWGTWPTPP